MFLPSGREVNSQQPIYHGSNFSWGEATRNCTRHPQDLIIDGKVQISSGEIEANIIRTAKELDQVRSLLGDKPILINSWYRPPHINARVGGARNSRHQYGDAVDIKSRYISPANIYKLLDKLHVDGGLGRYYSFVHIDWRGYAARWIN